MPAPTTAHTPQENAAISAWSADGELRALDHLSGWLKASPSIPTLRAKILRRRLEVTTVLRHALTDSGDSPLIAGLSA